ncbi:MAG: endoribonuclease YicC domain-containing protein, partial [Caldimonas sp.]
WGRAAVARQQQRFVERWNDALEQTGAAQSISREAAQERALNEAAAYAIRIDVAEELGRLGSHLDEIQRLLAKGGEVGKRLEFLIQELLREANTLGSKSSSIEMTAISVDMKVAIEQLREQVANVE